MKRLNVIFKNEKTITKSDKLLRINYVVVIEVKRLLISIVQNNVECFKHRMVSK